MALVPSESGAQTLLNNPAARDFVTDAFALRKFIAHGEAASPLLAKAGVADISDDGVVMLKEPGNAAAFIAACGELRFWPRSDA